jgi:hypothetical protein
MLIQIVVACLLIGQAVGDCGPQNYVTDPEPWGGAPCTKDLDCGGIGGGVCDFVNSTGKCACQLNRARANCSYGRMDVITPGVVNIVVAYFGLGGIGNLLIGGSRTGPGAGQLVLSLMEWAIIISLCGMCCCAICCESGLECGTTFTIIFYVVAVCCMVAAWIWSTVDGAFILECRYTDALGYAMFKS